MSAEEETFAQRVRRLIAEKGMSQSDLATRTGIDRTELNRIVNGKRQPKAREAAWLIEALDLQLEDFMVGLDVGGDPTFKEEFALHREAARRVLDAEREREEARGAYLTLQASFRKAEDSWRAERGELQGMVAEVRSDCGKRIQLREDEFAKRENQLLGDLSKARDQIAATERNLRQMHQLAEARGAQLAQLQRTLEAEKGKVLAAGFFGGIVGAVLGGGGVAAAAHLDDDDDE